MIPLIINEEVPTIIIRIDHSLCSAYALLRVKTYLSNIQKQLSPDVSSMNIDWQNDVGKFSFRYKNVPISGNLTMKDYSVEIKSKLPWVFFPLKGTVERIIRERTLVILN